MYRKFKLNNLKEYNILKYFDINLLGFFSPYGFHHIRQFSRSWEHRFEPQIVFLNFRTVPNYFAVSYS